VPHHPAAEPADRVPPLVPESRGGLNRRTPGARLSTGHPRPAVPRPGPARDALAEQVTVDAFMAGAARADGGPPEPGPNQPDPRKPTADTGHNRGGLTRRVPGAQLAPSVARRVAAGPVGLAPATGTDGRRPADSPPTGSAVRDPDLERAQLNRFLDGFARGLNTGEREAESISERQP
jgi:hypothetical protein